MITGLKEKVKEYSVSIKKSAPDYVILYDYFVEYINDQSNHDGLALKDFFSKSLTEFDIINSCVRYCERSNAKSKTAINKYLTAMTKFHNDVIIDYSNQNLKNAIPFSGLYTTVEQNLKKSLNPLNSCSPITDNDCDLILKYLSSQKRKSIRQKQVSIIWRMMLLYAFKFERIKTLKKECYNTEKRTLSIITDNNDRLELKLPYGLSLELEDYINDSRCNKVENMFSNTKGLVITPAFLNHSFKQLKELSVSNADKSGFCSTGLSKYAIMKMMEQKMSVTAIKMVSGMEDSVINDCARRYLNLEDSTSLNNFNHSINLQIGATSMYRSFENNKTIDK